MRRERDTLKLLSIERGKVIFSFFSGRKVAIISSQRFLVLPYAKTVCCVEICSYSQRQTRETLLDSEETSL